MSETRRNEQALPRWKPRPGLDPVELANALKIIGRTAHAHYTGGAFEPKHMQRISLLAHDALAGYPIAAPPDPDSPEFKAQVADQLARLEQLWDEELEHAVTVVGPHEHRFEPDPDRIDTRRCAEPRCTVLASWGCAHHPYREMRTPDGMLVAIDEDLTGLAQALWDRGVVTEGCCQGGCLTNGDGTPTAAYLLFRASDQPTVASILEGLPGLDWHTPERAAVEHPRQIVEWTATARCPWWQDEATPIRRNEQETT